MLDKKQLNDVGFDYVAQRLELLSPLGEELRRKASPLIGAGRAELCLELENVRLLADALTRSREAFLPLERALMQIKDVRRSVARSRETALSDVELFEVKRFLMLLERLVDAYSALPLEKKLNGIELFTLDEALCALDPDGMRSSTFRLSDNCSEELKSVRAERKRVDLALRKLENGGSDANKDALLAERLSLAAREENEEQRLRGEMTREFSKHSIPLEGLIASTARLEFALAKAKLMLELGGTIPEIAGEGEPDAAVELEDVQNPMLAAILKEKDGAFTPISIRLEVGASVITGANMGGKSVAVKTLALSAQLALSGFPVFARRARLPLFSDIHLLCEDMEDSRGGLSSFGGEMVRFNAILSEVQKNSGSLVLLDEFARGTNPSEGSALVRAAVRYFKEKRFAYALVTTHFDDVARLADAHYQVMGLRGADEVELMRALSAVKNEDGGSEDRKMLLARFMDYGLFRADGAENPPRDALKICRALSIAEEFMRYADGEAEKGPAQGGLPSPPRA